MATIMFAIEQITVTEECHFVRIANFQFVCHIAVMRLAIGYCHLFDVRCTAANNITDTCINDA